MKNIAILLCDDTNPFWVKKITCYKKYADAFGFKIVLAMPKKNGFPASQADTFDKLLQYNSPFDAIIVNPKNETTLVPLIIKARIPIFDIGPKCSQPLSENTIGSYYNPVFVVDFAEQGRICVEMLIERGLASARSAQGIKGKVLIISGGKNARQSQLRCAGAERTFLKYFTVMNIVKADSDFTFNGGYSAMRDILFKYDEISFVFCANDMMALGAIKALQEKHLSLDNIFVGGIDATDEATLAIQKGLMSATVGISHDDVVLKIYKKVQAVLDGKKDDSGYLINPKNFILMTVTPKI